MEIPLPSRGGYLNLLLMKASSIRNVCLIGSTNFAPYVGTFPGISSTRMTLITVLSWP